MTSTLAVNCFAARPFRFAKACVQRVLGATPVDFDPLTPTLSPSDEERETFLRRPVVSLKWDLRDCGPFSSLAPSDGADGERVGVRGQTEHCSKWRLANRYSRNEGLFPFFSPKVIERIPFAKGVLETDQSLETRSWLYS